MITQSISEARRKLADLIELARQGEEVVIIKDSKPVAALTPIDASDLKLVRLTSVQARRLKAWSKAQPKKKFASIAAAAHFLKKETSRRG
jgi:prevent-host-death family protein